MAEAILGVVLLYYAIYPLTLLVLWTWIMKR